MADILYIQIEKLILLAEVEINVEINIDKKLAENILRTIEGTFTKLLDKIQKLEEAQKNEILEKIENDLQIKIQNLHDKINKVSNEDKDDY
jgi:hypothetical protein